jgi:hypothetical protein
MSELQIELFQELVDTAIGITYGIVKALDDQYGALIWIGGNLHKFFNPVAETLFNNLILDVEVNGVMNTKFLRLQSIFSGSIHFRCLLNWVVILSVSAITHLERTSYDGKLPNLVTNLQQFMLTQISITNGLVACNHDHPKVNPGDRLFSITSEDQ